MHGREVNGNREEGAAPRNHQRVRDSGFHRNRNRARGAQGWHGIDRPNRNRPREHRQKMDYIRQVERRYDALVAVDPREPFRLETTKDELTGRILDLFAPIGRGQRAMIVAPPKAGKTIILQKIATALERNHPDVRVICLLIDERPEEVTDFKRTVSAEVIASCSDQTCNEHVQAVEEAFLTAKEEVLEGKDVVILMDSLTRLARAYNQYVESSGKTLTGGLDSSAMQRPRKFFGSARKIDNGGSLTVIATALIETGSRMDDIIFQEFKGTGNTEVVLSRKLAEQRIFPAFDLNQSGTRREERLFPPELYTRVRMIRRALSSLRELEAMQLLTEKMGKFESNLDFLRSITAS